MVVQIENFLRIAPPQHDELTSKKHNYQHHHFQRLIRMICTSAHNRRRLRLGVDRLRKVEQYRTYYVIFSTLCHAITNICDCLAHFFHMYQAREIDRTRMGGWWMIDSVGNPLRRSTRATSYHPSTSNAFHTKFPFHAP